VVPKVELMRADHYDGFAESYSTENESSLANAYYERPAMIDLAGDVSGRRVLDAGCGSGPLSAALRVKGAIVTGFDSSPAMVKLARQRLGGNAALCVADLSRPLPFADGAFDDVVSREPGTAFLAGGTTLVDLLRIYAVQPHHPVDINSLSLSDVDDMDGRGIRIGARAGGGRGDPGPGGLRRGARHHPPGRRDAGVVHTGADLRRAAAGADHPRRRRGRPAGGGGTDRGGVRLRRQPPEPDRDLGDHRGVVRR